MSTPIKSTDDIYNLYDYFESQGLRDYTIYHICVTFPIKIMKLLELKTSDIYKLNLDPYTQNLIELLIKENVLRFNEMPEYIISGINNQKPFSYRSFNRILSRGCKARNTLSIYTSESLTKSYYYHQYINGNLTIHDIMHSIKCLSPKRVIDYLHLSKEDKIMHELSKEEL